MAANYFGSASGNTMPHSVWCEYGETLSDSTGVEALCLRRSVCVWMGACLIAGIQPPKATIYSSRVLMNNTSVGIQCTLAFLSHMHAAREYRRKQRTFLMSCFNPCKSCQRAGCVLEHAVGLLCWVEYHCAILYIEMISLSWETSVTAKAGWRKVYLIVNYIFLRLNRPFYSACS